LEYQVGDVTAAIPFQPNVLQDYNGVLVAPSLDISGNPFLNAVNEDVQTSAGTRVVDLIARLGGTGITDMDGDPGAIAVTGLDTANGTWQYSTNGGTNWTNFGAVSTTAATLLGGTALYNVGRGGLPSTQGWLNYTAVNRNNPFTVLPTLQTASTLGTTLDTTSNNAIYAIYASYTSPLVNNPPAVNPAFPVLDNAQGYSVSFDLQILSEVHTDANRAGFSVIVLGSDRRGIELGFQQNGTTGNIFAQRGSTTALTRPASEYFIAEENAAFNVLTANRYTLTIVGDSYSLFANGSPTAILSGVLRDYQGYVPISQPLPGGTPDPYTIANSVAFGDGTTRANATVTFSRVTVQTDTRLRFQPNADYTGTATLTFKAWDTSDGLANGTTGITTVGNGSISSASETASLTVLPINDAPRYALANTSFTATSGTGVQTYAGAFTPGPANESTQTLQTQVLSNSNPSLFAAGGAPTVSSSGTLTFTPAGNLSTGGTATVQLQVQDNGGTNPGVNSVTQVISITVDAVPPPPPPPVMRRRANFWRRAWSSQFGSRTW
jgi:hypothetical protein